MTRGGRSWDVMTAIGTGRRPREGHAVHNDGIGAGTTTSAGAITTTTYSRLGDCSLPLLGELERATNAAMTSGGRSWGVMTSVGTNLSEAE